MEKTDKDAMETRGQQKTGASDFRDGAWGVGFLDVGDFENRFSDWVSRETKYRIFELLDDPNGRRQKILDSNIPLDAIGFIHDEPYHAVALKQAVGAEGFSPAYWKADGPAAGGPSESGRTGILDNADRQAGEDFLREFCHRLLIPFAGPAGRVCFVEYFSGRGFPEAERETLVNKTLFYLMGKLHAAGRGPAEQVASLSTKELECLRWAADGKTSAEIAIITGLSEHTVNHYLIFACNKLNAVNRAHAVAKAIRAGII